jgi:hypothetical protein
MSALDYHPYYGQVAWEEILWYFDKNLHSAQKQTCEGVHSISEQISLVGERCQLGFRQ